MHILVLKILIQLEKFYDIFITNNKTKNFNLKYSIFANIIKNFLIFTIQNSK